MTDAAMMMPQGQLVLGEAGSIRAMSRPELSALQGEREGQRDRTRSRR